MPLRIPRPYAYCALYVGVAWSINVVFVLMQYTKYGFSFPLGYDPPRNIWYAMDIVRNGPVNELFYLFNGHLQLYLQLVALLGYLSGFSVSAYIFWIEFLPFIFSGAYILTTFFLTYRISGNAHAAGLAAVLSGVSFSTFRSMSDFNQQMTSLTIVFALLPALGRFLPSSSIDRKNLIWILAGLFLVENIHFETFFILGVALIVYLAFVPQRKVVFHLGICLLVVVLMIPLYVSYFRWYYEAQFTSISVPAVGVQTSFPYMVFSLGVVGAVIPNLIQYVLFGAIWLLGLVWLVKKAKITATVRDTQSHTALLVVSWAIGALATLVLIIATGAGIEWWRTTFILPSTVFSALGICYLWHFPIHIKVTSLKVFKPRAILIVFLGLLLVVNVASISYANIDQYLTPLPGLDRTLLPKIQMIAETLLSRHLSATPMFVFWMNQEIIWEDPQIRSALGFYYGDHYLYYGRLQNALFQLNPNLFYPLDFSAEGITVLSFHAQLYYREMLVHSGGLERLATHPIVVVVPTFYPSNDPLLATSLGARSYIGNGIYVIDPPQITNEARNTWVYQTYRDFQALKNGYATPPGYYSWSVAPRVLESFFNDSRGPFYETFSAYLLEELNYTLSLRLFPLPLYVFGLNSLPVSSLQFYVDGNLFYQYMYPEISPGYPIWLNATIPNMPTGLHTVTLYMQPPAAFQLDTLVIYPTTITLTAALTS